MIVYAIGGKRIEMAENKARQKLLDFLDKKAFEPVLKASPDDYDSERDKEKLKEVQETTRSTQESYHKRYTTTEDVVKNFRSDLSSEPAKKVHGELRSLGLPTLPDIKDEFNRLVDELDI
jgi:uncharacterized protein (UPF0305 family)